MTAPQYRGSVLVAFLYQRSYLTEVLRILRRVPSSSVPILEGATCQLNLWLAVNGTGTARNFVSLVTDLVGYHSKSQFIGYPDNQPVLKSANTQIATALSGKTHSKSNSEEVGEENVNTQRHIRTGISIFIFRFYNICNGILAVFISQTSVHI